MIFAKKIRAVTAYIAITTPIETKTAIKADFILISHEIR